MWMRISRFEGKCTVPIRLLPRTGGQEGVTGGKHSVEWNHRIELFYRFFNTAKCMAVVQIYRIGKSIKSICKKCPGKKDMIGLIGKNIMNRILCFKPI